MRVQLYTMMQYHYTSCGNLTISELLRFLVIHKLGEQTGKGIQIKAESSSCVALYNGSMNRWIIQKYSSKEFFTLTPSDSSSYLFKLSERMGTFQYGRLEGFPAIYSPHHTAVTVDVTEVIFIAAFVIIAISFVAIIPSYRKKQVSIYNSAYI